MEQIADKELVVRAQKELPYNTHSFEVLISRYEQKNFNLSLSILKDYHLAEDATQNTMLRIFHYLKNFNNESSFFTWVYRIAYNESVQIINKNKTTQLNAREFEHSYTQQLDHELEVEKIKSTLDDEEQEILHLKYELEFKDEEIAKIFGIELSACKMRLKRLKDKIKNKYH